MNRLLKIVGRISDKSAKIRVLGSVVLLFVALLMVFSVYSVFGEGITGGVVSGSVVNADGSAFWEKDGIGKIEWDLFETHGCMATRYLNLTSYLDSQDLDVCIRTDRPLAGSVSDAWLWKNMSNPVVEQVWVNTTYCENNCSESGYYQENVVGEEWYPNWFNIKDLFNHVSYDGDEFYCLKNVYAEQNKKYELKLSMGFTYFHDGISGCDEKFGIVAKRSSESLSDALSFEHYVELDPVYSDNETLLFWTDCANNGEDKAQGTGQGGNNTFNVTGSPVFLPDSNSSDGFRCSMDGTDDKWEYDDTNNTLLDNGTKSYTICFFFNSTRSTGNCYPVHKGPNDHGSFMLIIGDEPGYNSNHVRHNFADADAADSASNQELQRDLRNNYYCKTYNGATHMLNHYLNGMPDGDNNNFPNQGPFTTDGLSDMILSIGNSVADTDYFPGEFDEVTFFNTDLLAEDISFLWNNSGKPQISNTAPTIQGNQVTLTPEDEADPDFDLSCTFNATDAENTTLLAYVEWYNHNVKDEANSINKYITSGEFSSFLLEDANTTIGDKWFCNVSVSDGELNSDWVASSETEIVSVANKTDFTTQLQSLNVKDVFVYDASRESWNRTGDPGKSWYFDAEKDFPDKTYLFLTDDSLDIFDSSDTSNPWMIFTGGVNNAIDGNDFTSVYALDGRIYVGSDKGLYVLDFAGDNLTRYNTNGLAYNDSEPFREGTTGSPGRNTHITYNVLDGSKTLSSDVVNDVNANRIRGENLVGVATDEGVNIINIDDETVAGLAFSETPTGQYDSESVFIADDGTIYYSENHINQGAEKTRLSYKYNIDSYSGTGNVADGVYLSKGSGSRSASYPHFIGERINDIYVTPYTSRRHFYHNTVYIGTEKGISVIQEFQGDEGYGVSKSYSYTGSAEDVNYKILEGSTDNVTAVTARSDGNAMYVGTNNGAGLGSVSKISLNSNTLVDSWNTTTDITIVGNDTTSLDFLDGDLLVGTLDSGATQIVEEELDHYLITDYTNHRVVEIDNTGLIHWAFGVYGTAGNGTYLTNPTYAERHTDGNYLIADSGNRRILEVNPDGEIIQEITNGTQLSDATSFGEVYSVQKIT